MCASKGKLVAVRINGVEVRPRYINTRERGEAPGLICEHLDRAGEAIYRHGCSDPELLAAMPDEMAADIKAKGLKLYLCAACHLQLEKGVKNGETVVEMLMRPPISERLRVALEAECKRGARKADMPFEDFFDFVYKLKDAIVAQGGPEGSKPLTAKKEAKMLVEMALDTLHQLHTTGTIAPGVLIHRNDGPPQHFALGQGQAN